MYILFDIFKKKTKKKKAPKPKSFGLKNLDIKPEDVTLDLALELLRYPLVLGLHPEDGEEVVMQMGPFGWYVSHAGLNASLPKKLLASIREDAVNKVVVREVTDEVTTTTTTTFDLAADSTTTTEEEKDASSETREAAVLRARYCPVPLELAVELITKKRLKPPAEGGRWGRKKKTTEVDKLGADGDTKKKKKGAKKPEVTTKPKPNKAKRPLSAYMLYCAEARGSLTEGLTAPEQAKLLGAQWKSLDEGEKSKFENLAREAKEAASKEKEKEKMISSRMSGDGRTGGTKTKTKAKRTPSAYLLFCSEARKSSEYESLRGLKVTEQAKELGAAWKSLGEEERSKYQAMARDAKEAAAAAASAS